MAIVMGQAPPSRDCNVDGLGTPFVKAGEFSTSRPLIREWTTNPLKQARKTDVLLCVVGATCGKLNLGEDCAIGRSVAALRPKPEILDQYYLHYFMMTLVDRLRSGSVGAAQTVISKEMIQSLLFPWREVQEQHRIVAILDEAFDGIATAKANAERNLLNARAIFESHLQSVFTQRGDGWVSTTIGESCTLKSGTTVPVSIERSSGDIPYVKVAEMTLPDNQDGITTSIRFLDRPDVKPGWLIPKGAVIFPKRGGAILTNKKRLSLVDMCADLNIMSVIPSESITPEFLYFYFLTVDMRKLGTGSSIPQINHYDLAPLESSYPKSLLKQAEIAGSIRSLESESQALESIYQQKLTALDDLKKSLLNQAFTGQL